MNALAHQLPLRPAANRSVGGGGTGPRAPPCLALRIISAALRESDATSSPSFFFGTESAALLKVMADVDPAIPVIFLDTVAVRETLAYSRYADRELGLTGVRSIKPLTRRCRAKIRKAISGSEIPTPAAVSARWNRWRVR